LAGDTGFFHRFAELSRLRELLHPSSSVPAAEDRNVFRILLLRQTWKLFSPEALRHLAWALTARFRFAQLATVWGIRM
jgi:hypothetical protein